MQNPQGATSGASASAQDLPAQGLTQAASASAQSGAPQASTPAPDISVHDAQGLIAQANSDHFIQTSFQHSPKPNGVTLEWLEALGRLIRGIFKVLGKIFEPLGPIVPYLLWLLVFILVVALASPVVRMFISTRFERFFLRGNLKEDVRWRPTKEAVAALLEEIDALAAKGEYDEAVHLLLIRSVADINAYRPDLVRIHYSARDIGSHPHLPDTARPAFAEIIRWAEISYFGGQTVGKEGFDACREAYMAFIRAEGIA